MKDLHITFADRDLAEEYSVEIAEILSVLGMDPDSYIVSDESSLIDFSTCCPEHVDLEADSKAGSWKDLRDRWEMWAKQEFPRWFPELYFSDNFLRTPLVVLASQLRESRSRKPS